MKDISQPIRIHWTVEPMIKAERKMVFVTDVFVNIASTLAPSVPARASGTAFTIRTAGNRTVDEKLARGSANRSAEIE